MRTYTEKNGLYVWVTIINTSFSFYILAPKK